MHPLSKLISDRSTWVSKYVLPTYYLGSGHSLTLYCDCIFKSVCTYHFAAAMLLAPMNKLRSFIFDSLTCNGYLKGYKLDTSHSQQTYHKEKQILLEYTYESES